MRRLTRSCSSLSHISLCTCNCVRWRQFGGGVENYEGVYGGVFVFGASRGMGMDRFRGQVAFGRGGCAGGDRSVSQQMNA